MAAVLGGTRVGIILKGEHGHERGDPSASSGSKLPGDRCLTVVGTEGHGLGPTAKQERDPSWLRWDEVERRFDRMCATAAVSDPQT